MTGFKLRFPCVRPGNKLEIINQCAHPIMKVAQEACFLNIDYLIRLWLVIVIGTGRGIFFGKF